MSSVTIQAAEAVTSLHGYRISYRTTGSGPVCLPKMSSVTIQAAVRS